MKITELKSIAKALETYATIRDTSGPESLVGVQATASGVKLIAGNSMGGVSVRVPGAEYVYPAKFVVNARTFLQAVRALKGKMELTIGVNHDALLIESDKGGKISMPAVASLSEAGFAKKPKSDAIEVPINAGEFPQIAKLFDVVAQDIESQTPTINTLDGAAYVTAVSPGSHALYASLKSTSEVSGWSRSAYMDFWRSLKAIEGQGSFYLHEDGVLATSHDVECFSAPYKVAKYDPRDSSSARNPVHPEPWPRIEMTSEPPISVVVEKRALIDAIKGVADSDEHARVTIGIGDNAVTTYAFGDEDSSIALPASTTGTGIRSVNSEYLLQMLRAIDAKEVKIGWSERQPAIVLTAQGYENWAILVAPVSLR